MHGAILLLHPLRSTTAIVILQNYPNREDTFLLGNGGILWILSVLSPMDFVATAGSGPCPRIGQQRVLHEAGRGPRPSNCATEFDGEKRSSDCVKVQEQDARHAKWCVQESME